MFRLTLVVEWAWPLNILCTYYFGSTENTSEILGEKTKNLVAIRLLEALI